MVPAHAEGRLRRQAAPLRCARPWLVHAGGLDADHPLQVRHDHRRDSEILGRNLRLLGRRRRVFRTDEERGPREPLRKGHRLPAGRPCREFVHGIPRLARERSNAPAVAAGPASARA